MNERKLLSTCGIIERYGLCLQTYRYHVRTMHTLCLNQKRVCNRSKTPQIFKNGLYLDRKAIFW